MAYEIIKNSDPEAYNLLIEEDNREEHTLELIASENITSLAVRNAYTSSLTNKYAEGYPGKRYYGGCGPSDKIEDLAIERAKKLFNVKYANVQPHSGAQANMAVFLAALKPGDTFLGMDLAHGGHLTHGSHVNFSGLLYNPVGYTVDPETQMVNYDLIRKLALEHKPKLIIAGFSAYPRKLDFAKFREIADEVGALLMTDMAHIAGLIAAGLHPSPIEHSDFVTTTTHKTLRGPRGGMILSNNESFFKKLNSRVFPGVQGGPLMHVIAAKAVAFGEALKPDFIEYQKQVLANAQTLADTLVKRGLELVTGGTDNHLMIVNTFATKKITGKDAQELLEKAGVTTNKNALPFDPNPPAIASGIRLGTPALTTRGFKEKEMDQVGNLIADVLDNPVEGVIEKVREQVMELCRTYPLEHYNC